MERAEATFDAVMGALEAHDVAEWSTQELQLFVSLVTTYHTQRVAQANSAKAEEDGTTHTSCDEKTAMAVAEVDRGLAQVRRFLLTQPTATAATKNPTHVPYARTDNKDSFAPCVAQTNDIKTTQAQHDAPVYCVDAFLYDNEEAVEELVQQGTIAREYCRACGSTDIGLTEFITHSFAQDQLVYLSCFLLPMLLRQPSSSSSTDKVIVDVGSRLGVVLWSCYYAATQGLLPNVKCIAGVELDGELVQLQQRVQERVCRPRRQGLCATATHNSDNTTTMADVCVVHSDCFEGTGAATLSNADVVILHNVFEFFCDSPEAHLRAWLRLRDLVRRPGQLLICCPSLAETFRDFDANVLHECGFVVEGEKDTVGNVSTQDNKARHARHTTTMKKRARGDNDSTTDSATQGMTVTQWLNAYVEPVSHDALAAEFVAWRQSQDDDCDNEEEEAGEHACGGCCQDDDKGSECGGGSELQELIHNMYVYRVK